MEIDEADLGDNIDVSDEKTPDLNDEGMCTHIYHLLEQAYLHIVEPIECENCIVSSAFTVCSCLLPTY